jgi:hypothetical protein
MIQSTSLVLCTPRLFAWQLIRYLLGTESVQQQKEEKGEGHTSGAKRLLTASGFMLDPLGIDCLEIQTPIYSES